MEHLGYKALTGIMTLDIESFNHICNSAQDYHLLRQYCRASNTLW